MYKSYLLLSVLLFIIRSMTSFAQESELIKEEYAGLKKTFISAEISTLTGDEPTLINQSFNGFSVYETTLSSRLSLQYRIGTALSIGAGTGIDFYQINTVLPLYLAITGNLSKKKLSPFYQFNLGHAFPWSKEREEYDYSGGLYWEASVGLQSWVSETQALFFKIGLQRQNISIEYPFGWTAGGRTIQEHRLERLRAGLGFIF